VAEVSESAHLRTDNPEHAVALLRRAKLPGYVFPARNGWVTFVYPPGDENRFDLEQANERLLLLYEYAADLGCWVTVYEGKKPVTRLRAQFDRPNPAFDRAIFEKLELLTPISANAVAQWTKTAHNAFERRKAPYFIAERLQLPRYQWLSFLSEQTKELPDAQRIEVQKNGTVKRPKKPSAPHVALPSTTKAKAKTSSKKKSKAPAKNPANKAAKNSANKPATKPAAKKKGRG
jgi:hypothetical protein